MKKLRNWIKKILGIDTINYIKSTKPGSNGYLIYLDNIKQELCIEANVKEGWVSRYIKVTNSFEEAVYSGMYKVDKNGKPIIETLYGKVEIMEIQDIKTFMDSDFAKNKIGSGEVHIDKSEWKDGGQYE